MKITHLSLILAISLAACGPASLPPPQKEVAIVNGPWAVLPKSCQIHGRTEDFTFATDGHVENGFIYLYLTFKTPQAAAPAMSITGISIPLSAEGKSPVFSYKMPFTPAIASALAQPATYFTIRYYSAHESHAFESALPTNGFIEALNQLGVQCR